MTERFPWDETVATMVKAGFIPPADWLPGCEGIFQRGMAHSLVGLSSAGKSITCLALAVTVLKDGETVVYADQENGSGIIADRLIGLGVDAKLVASGLRYLPFPSPAANETREFVATIQSVSPALVILDSGPDFIGAAGFDENDNTNYTNWAKEVPQTLARSGAAVVVLEPVNASGEKTRGRGATAKRFKADVVLLLEKTRPFGRTRVGEVKVSVQKDRTGNSVEGDYVCFAIGGDGEGHTTFVRTESGSAMEDQGDVEEKFLEMWAATAVVTARVHAPDEAHALSTVKLAELMGPGKVSRKREGIAWAAEGLRPGDGLHKRAGSHSAVEYWLRPAPTVLVPSLSRPYPDKEDDDAVGVVLAPPTVLVPRSPRKGTRTRDKDDSLVESP
jgi:hypothetical protein